jgi:hypothetical protein
MVITNGANANVIRIYIGTLDYRIVVGLRLLMNQSF